MENYFGGPQAGNDYGADVGQQHHQGHHGGDQSGEPSEGKLIQNSEVSNDAKMFVGGLARTTNSDSLKTYFSKFGPLRDVSVKMDSMTQSSRGFGFVLFENADSVDAVVAQPVHMLDGKKIDPKKAERRDGKMFVGGILGETTDETIRSFFSKYGDVEVIDRPLDKATGNYKGFCFVTFKRDGVMRQAVKDRFHEIDGKRCETKEGVPKSQMNPGFGGGGGGGGYGGQGGQQGGYGGYGGQGGGYQQGGGYGGGYGGGGGGGGGYGGGRGGGRGGGYGGSGGYGGGAQGSYGGGAAQGGYAGGYGGGQAYGGGGQAYGGGYGGYEAPRAAPRGGRGGGPPKYQPY